MNFLKLMLVLPIFITVISLVKVNAQNCKVITSTIDQEYKGECKKGLANGEGEAIGVHKYIGTFKDGMPNGSGTYFYSDSLYYNGNFQDGIKEGKGEMHDIRIGASDSLIKGYWSGGEYRGKTYITYNVEATNKLDRFEIFPTKGKGHLITIEISAGTGPASATLTQNKSYDLSLTELICVDDNSLIQFFSDFKSQNKSSWTYQVKQFPIKLQGTFSNGKRVNLNLYKSSNWTIRLYPNR